MNKRPSADEDLPEEEKFFWHKKRQLEARSGLSRLDAEVLETERREHNRKELERIRKQREEREVLIAKKKSDREHELLEKERESNLGDWEEKERIFHLTQAYQKIYLRCIEGRARPLHLFALPTLRLDLFLNDRHASDRPREIFLLSDDKISPALDSKYFSYDDFEAASIELDDLLLGCERDSKMLEYWKAFKAAISLRKQLIRENRILQIVNEDIKAVFKGKSVEKLFELRQGIDKKLKDPQVDTDYWNGLLNELDRVIVRAELDEMYVSIAKDLENDALKRHFAVKRFSFCDYLEGIVHFTNFERRDAKRERDTVNEEKEEQQPGSTVVPFGKHLNWDNCSAAMALLEQEHSRHVGKDELPFNNEAEDLLKTLQRPNWHPKFPHIKPIKPRFFNRVRMNYVWNKYNQTHYDSANPPPKVVQGFRFNIFYPALNDSSKVPTYRREPDPTNPENQIVRFMAGAPYEDVVFRIPNEEWDMSSQHGFRCIFERNALRLHFWLRAERYRR